MYRLSNVEYGLRIDEPAELIMLAVGPLCPIVAPPPPPPPGPFPLAPFTAAAIAAATEDEPSEAAAA